MSNETQIKRIKIQNFKGLRLEGEVLETTFILQARTPAGKLVYRRCLACATARTYRFETGHDRRQKVLSK
jgi:hypothetical protein